MKQKNGSSFFIRFDGSPRPSSLKTAEVENHYFQNFFLTGLAKIHYFQTTALTFDGPNSVFEFLTRELFFELC